MPQQEVRDRKRQHPLVVCAALETLEARQLLFGDPSVVQALPYALEFTEKRGGIVDVDGQGTGFTLVQSNKNGNEYNPALIDLRLGAGVLNIRTTGTATAGSNYSSDNTLVDALETQFNGSSAPFSITTRLRGPLSYINEAYEQGGIYFGPDQDHYVKLVAAATPTGTQIQFLCELKSGSTFTFPLGSNGKSVNPGSFASITSLDLTLVGNPGSGKISAYYSVNGGATSKFADELTLTGSDRSAFFGTAARAGILASHKNNTAGVTVSFDRFAILDSAPTATEPSIVATRPANGATGVSRDIFVAADVFLPTSGAGIDSATLSSDSVRLERVSDGQLVSAVLNTSAAGDALVLQPQAMLAANTQYRFIVTEGLRDVSGASFEPYQSTFTTGSTVAVPDPKLAFEQVELPTAHGRLFSGVTVGPDGKLYATTLTGEICRWIINPGGTLGEIEVLDSIITNNGGPRFVTGLAFDPASTATNLIAWVTHGQYAFEGADDWTGRITRLTGANLENYKEMVTGLPRSIRDHLTNQPTFGPGGFLYFPQGSNTALGKADSVWGMRNEHQLTAAILRLDTAAVVARRASGQGPLNVKTESGGTYNAFAANAPLTIYASGVRNAYNVLYHSNGRLYAPTNGSAAGGNTPGTPSNMFSNNRIDFAANGPYTGPSVAAINGVSTTQDDFLFSIQQNGYYGHPNPTRSEYVLHGGNPTSGADPNEVLNYSVGTKPDRNYRGAAFTFGKNFSPNGAIEYRSNSFKGALKGRILVTRYSGGDDVIVLSTDASGNITKADTGVAGLTHLVDPLDLAEDLKTGCVFVVEFGAERITLLRPVTPGGNLKLDSDRLLFNDIKGDGSATVRKLTLTNAGSKSLTIPAGGLVLTFSGSELFKVGGLTLPATIPVGESRALSISFEAAGSSSLDIKSATLEITSNDPDQPKQTVQLRGLPTTGTGGTNEPSLQRVLDLHQIPLNVGDSSPGATYLDMPPKTPNDEITVQRFVKAGSGRITIEPVAMFGVASEPSLRFGWYEPGTGANRTELFSVDDADAQSVNVTELGTTNFDPGASAFGIYGLFPKFSNSDGSVRVVYQEDALNTWESISANRRKVRVYPFKQPDGSVEKNAYLFAFEEFTQNYDYQDFVGIIRNVKPAPSGPELGVENLDGSPFFDRLVFNKILNLDPEVPNAFKETGKLRIRNTGNQDLNITSLSTSGRFAITSGGGAGTLEPGQSRDLTITFNATGGDIQNGKLTIQSNDSDEPTRVINLSGFWQSYSENDPSNKSQEPTLVEIGQVFGYSTTIVGSGQSINTQGNIVRVGDEVLSSFWVRADSSQPVRVRQLAAFHTQGQTTTFSYFNKGSQNATAVFTAAGVDGQSFLPRKNNALSSAAAGQFSPSVSQAFGIKVDDVWSEQSRNDNSGGGQGHYMRFYPARDQNGSFIPNTFILAMDYKLVLADYQDNVYIIENIRPERLPSPPGGVGAIKSGERVTLSWVPSGGNVTGYNIFRSTTPTGKFKQINSVLVTTTSFADSVQFPTGTTFYYRITAVDSSGMESIPTSISVAV